MRSETHHPLDTPRRMASQALEKAGDTMQDLRTGMQDMASRSLSAMSGSAAAAQRQLGQATQAGTRYVADHPMKAALIALAVGATVAALFQTMRRRRQPWRYD